MAGCQPRRIPRQKDAVDNGLYQFETLSVEIADTSETVL